jgi:hypothetical protein
MIERITAILGYTLFAMSITQSADNGRIHTIQPGG